MGDQELGNDWSDAFRVLEELRSIGEAGAILSNDSETRERFQRVVNIAEELAVGKIVSRPEVSEDISSQWLHVSPIMSSDCAAFDEDGQILLIKRNDNRMWALPGGLVDVGEGPANASVREAYEEVGLESVVGRLVGMYDSRDVDTDTPFQVIHFVFLCNPQLPANLRLSSEVVDFGWFKEGQLPTIAPGHEPRIRDAFKLFRGELESPPIV